MLRNKCRKRCRDLWENMGVNSCQHMYDRRYVGMCRDCTSQALLEQVFFGRTIGCKLHNQQNSDEVHGPRETREASNCGGSVASP